MSETYRAQDWYWIIGSDASRVWASARQTYVPLDDAGHLAFRNSGAIPTRIASEAELWDVLAQQAPNALPAEAEAQDRLAEHRLNAFDAVSFRLAFNHENRIRTLEGRAAATSAQFRAAIKTILQV